MSDYTSVEELKQIPIEEIKRELNSPSETVLEYQEYLSENRGIVMPLEDIIKLKQIAVKI